MTTAKKNAATAAIKDTDLTTAIDFYLSEPRRKLVSLSVGWILRSKRIQLPKIVLAGRWVHCDACMCLFSTLNPSRLSFNFRR